jgi:uncharacterized protein (TIGR02452 family)
MSKRSTRMQIAQETVAVLSAGFYTLPGGRQVSIQDDLTAARSVLYRPDDFGSLFSQRDRLLSERGNDTPTRFEVANETTLHAARRLLDRAPATRPLALNFASARHPGGGFLSGSQAQEESLARASGLYACLNQCRGMYDANARTSSCLYTDHMIYSPDVPVFRDDEGAFLERAYRLSFVTAPAVNVRALRHDHGRDIERVMLSRMEKILSVALIHGHDTLILGAWGCGVFRNDPRRVAAWFHQHLTGAGRFATAFRTVIFAVLDGTADQSTIAPFQRYFGSSQT